MLTETEKAYLAGFIDGEGCIMIHRGKQRNGAPRHQLRLDIAQANKNFIESLQKTMGLGAVSLVKRRSRNRAPCYHWVLHDRQAEELLKAVRPYLRIKGDQADIAFKFLDSRAPGHPLTETVISFRDECKRRLQEAKKR